MRRLVLLALFACGSSTPRSTGSSEPIVTTEPASTSTPAGANSAPPISQLQPTPPAKPPPPAPPSPPPAPVANKTPLYSCFSYIAANTTTRRSNCMRTPDCPDLLEQAKQLKGIRELTGCASVASVWCFHQLVKGDPVGVDVCQPTQTECAAARTATVKAKESVDTDCAQR